MAAWRDLDSSKQMGEAGRLLVVGFRQIFGKEILWLLEAPSLLKMRLIDTFYVILFDLTFFWF